ILPITMYYKRARLDKPIGKSVRYLVWTLSLFTSTLPSWSGVNVDRTVTGTDSEEEGEEPPGVRFMFKGTQQGTTTDINGKYTLNLTQENPILVFSFVGFISQEVAVGNESVLDIRLVSDTKALDELVVVGYGMMKKSDLTGSVVRINLE